MLKMMKERREKDEERQKKLVVGGLLLDKIYLHDPTVIFFYKKNQMVKI